PQSGHTPPGGVGHQRSERRNHHCDFRRDRADFDYGWRTHDSPAGRPAAAHNPQRHLQHRPTAPHLTLGMAARTDGQSRSVLAEANLMQQRREAARRAFTNNLMWFAGSLALAFFVWVIATLDSDPIV